eukprot:CAMPEP_0116826404 /NCGR_PEP_ID=MMETSP0418-20121206/2509_1 /TAXON_ID=1158023 /ORGANISM="Astrosyne radiata, Strain 13vi08-1A" /LENGTH=639 /DNA_ID=CAMNT_0004455033 /DNA_START=436 /DNA_END=2354 /DNA_ORIENTATION=-
MHSRLRLVGGHALKAQLQRYTNIQASSTRPHISFHGRLPISRSFRTSSQLLSDSKPIKVLYGSQGGTAQIFALQAAELLEEKYPDDVVTTSGLDEVSTPSENLEDNAIHIFLVSVTGVGEPPDNARHFYEWLMTKSSGEIGPKSDYAVFGLGNKVAHPNHFNVIGKNIDKKLEEIGAKRVFALGLGDDGDCIEDDFDTWLEGLANNLGGNDSDGEKLDQDPVPEAENPAGTVPNNLLPPKHPALVMQSAPDTGIHGDLLHVPSLQFYQDDVEKLAVKENQPLHTVGSDQTLHEMCLSLPHGQTYQTGDHVAIYPKNPTCLVDAFLWLYDDVDPYATILENGDESYPHPTGISLYDTLLHCVDLGAVPSPSFTRYLQSQTQIDYKADISDPRRTVLDMILSSSLKPPLQDLLHGLPPMKARYYSIASSPLSHPSEVFITYRPVKYVTSRGHLREGICTGHLRTLTKDSSVVAAVRSNPSFRLPEDPSIPVIFVAGGCGIAPIRAFLEERLAEKASYGTSHMFLGFRSPTDEVYRSLMEKALDEGAIHHAHITYSSGCTGDQQCRLVSEAFRDYGKLVFDLVQQENAHVYLCGGARTFGAAIEKELMDILFENGNFSDEEEVTSYMQKLANEGRLCEDLAD